ncbi:zinc-dependent alcohol dehydrogenase [Dyadobacter tibetensis]|uniref:zinc-dependent alcohol dehydrogenase n=1 Tax=Dyadobacter tibetensis TaxID=1211851 RepID=UPI0004705A43|nr:Zn-dependent alcohol dehydrogenase [Dyadobacter tibetensis]
MKATVYQGNKTFSVVENPIEEPKEGEVRIKVAYVGICGTDVHVYHGNMDKRVQIPQTIGHEMSGVIDAVGPGVTDIVVGDKVVVRPLDDRAQQASDKGISHICEKLKFIGVDSPGAMQQYWNVPAFTIHQLQPETDLKLAALTEPLAVACHDVRLSELIAGETAVVLGGGPIGLLIAKVAARKGAQVIISEVNEARVQIAQDLGFTVVNPMNQDIQAYVQEVTDGRKADVVFEVAGVQPSVDIMTKLAGIRGRVVMVAIHAQPKSVNLFDFFWKELRLIGARVYEKEDYEEAIQLITENELAFEKLITEVLPLDSIQEAFESIDRNPAGIKTLLKCQ